MMKRSFVMVTALMLIPNSAHAFDLRSPNGITQQQWNNSPEYLDFKCPVNTSKGEGVDMNFTIDRSDDFYFVTCNPIYVIPTIENPIETSTVTVIPNVSVTIDTPTTTVSSNSTVTQTTQTIPTLTENTDFMSWFSVWFAKWFKTWFANWLGFLL
jgi:hypothetical protein